MSLTMSKVTDEPPSYTRIAHLTSTGDGREGERRRQPMAQTLAWADTAVSDDEEDDDATGYGYGHAPAEQVPYSNIQEIIPGLFIGDVTAAMDHTLLKSKNITVIIAAMRQRYSAPEVGDFAVKGEHNLTQTLHLQGVKVNRIFIDDTSKTNILRYFPESNAIIREARQQGKNVLVHCQAGVSRSSTLCAAFLMEELDLTADEAIEKIASVRSVVQPLEFFLHQLEIFERCNFELDPNKHAAYRRFLMNFNAQEMIGGEGVDDLILAYYPTPAPSPRRLSVNTPDPFLSMTPMAGGASTPRPTRSRRGSSVSITSQEARSEILARVRRGSAGTSGMSSNLSMSTISAEPSSISSSSSRRMSDGQHLAAGDFPPPIRRKSSRAKSTGERDAELKRLRALLNERKQSEADQVSKHKEAFFADQEAPVASSSTAAKSGPHVRTSRLRCKMCRRELVSREHVLEHEPGQGQKAFAPTRRDMTQHRLDTEKRRQEKAAEREARQVERQRLAAEAAEDLIQEVEEVDSSVDGDQSDHNPENVQKGQQEETMKIDEINRAEDKDRSAVSTSPKRHTMPTATRPNLGVDQGSRSLSSRLPPQLAALRVAMPVRPFGHDLNNAIDGSAIDDDEATPGAEEPPLLPSSACTSYFTEPLSWMRPQLENGDLSGKLMCPNTRCNAKLGTFDWSGLRCSCAAWISPGFALNASKVDEIRM